MLRSSTSGVSPIRSSTDDAIESVATSMSPPAIAGSRITVAPSCDRRLEPVERPHVFVVDVDVDEGRDLTVVEELARESGIGAREIVENLGHGAAARVDLPRAAYLCTQRRRDANCGHSVPSARRRLADGGRLVRRALAKFHVVDVLGDRRLVAANRAVAAPLDRDLHQARREGIEEE